MAFKSSFLLPKSLVGVLESGSNPFLVLSGGLKKGVSCILFLSLLMFLKTFWVSEDFLSYLLPNNSLFLGLKWVVFLRLQPRLVEDSNFRRMFEQDPLRNSSLGLLSPLISPLMLI